VAMSPEAVAKTAKANQIASIAYPTPSRRVV